MPLSYGGAEPCLEGKQEEVLQQHREGRLRLNLINFYHQKGTKEKEKQLLPCKRLEYRDKLQLRWKRHVALTTTALSFIRFVD